MPQDSPQVGEIWEHSGQEGLIISLSQEAVRLLSRSGRRVLMPLRSLGLLWRFQQEAPSTQRVCEMCSSDALLQYTLDGEHHWVCDTHIPQGMNVLFHSDDPARGLEFSEQFCPLCQKNTDVGRDHHVTLDTRTYVRQLCSECNNAWYSVNHMDMIALDTTLHVSDLAETFSPETRVSIECGGAAHRDIVRAVGSGNISQLQGFPFRRSSDLPEEMVLVIGRRHSSLEGLGQTNLDPLEHPLIASAWCLKSDPRERVLVQQALGNTVTVEQDGGSHLHLATMTLEEFHQQYMPFNAALPQEVQDQLEKQAEQVGPVQDDAVPAVGTFWRRRRVDNSIVICTVKSLWENHLGPWVVYDIVYDPTNSAGPANQMLADQFVEHWTKVTSTEEAQSPEFYMPLVGSYWKRIDTHRVVRVEEPTLRGRTEQEVRFQFLEGARNHGEEKLRTFSRLHVELPYPPGDALWFDDYGFYWVSSWEGGSNYAALDVEIQQFGGSSEKMPLDELYHNFTPLTFTAEAGILSLRQGQKWSDGEHEFTVYDLVFYKSVVAVRFTGEHIEKYNTYEPRGTRLAVIPTSQVHDKMTWVVPPAPCNVGERWSNKPKGDHVNRPDLVIEGLDGENQRAYCRLFYHGTPSESVVCKWVTYEKLVEEYYKLDVKSVWEIFDEDD